MLYDSSIIPLLHKLGGKRRIGQFLEITLVSTDINLKHTAFWNIVLRGRFLVIFSRNAGKFVPNDTESRPRRHKAFIVSIVKQSRRNEHKSNELFM
jgi:hypothetical protein